MRLYTCSFAGREARSSGALYSTPPPPPGVPDKRSLDHRVMKNTKCSVDLAWNSWYRAQVNAPHVMPRSAA